jgi:DNA polymerase elongation subunit (family B)
MCTGVVRVGWEEGAKVPAILFLRKNRFFVAAGLKRDMHTKKALFKRLRWCEAKKKTSRVEWDAE